VGNTKDKYFNINIFRDNRIINNIFK